jgi:hypothetical protein
MAETGRVKKSAGECLRAKISMAANWREYKEAVFLTE